MKIRRFNLAADEQADIIANQMVATIRIPFWKRVKMLFCSWLRVTAPVKIKPSPKIEPPPGSPEYAAERTVIRVENHMPIKLTAEVVIPFDAQQYMNEHEIYRFVMDELMKQFLPKLRDVTRIDKYSDPIQCNTVIRGVIGVVDMRNC